MKIIVGDVFSKIVSHDRKTLALVRDMCRARPSGYMYMPRYRNGTWDGYISLMQGLNQFPTGLLQYVLQGLEHAGVSHIEIADSHIVDAFKAWKHLCPDMLHGVELRAYQLQAANALLRSGRGVAKMATNAGKTEVMAAIIKALSLCGTPCSALVVVHRKELMYQTRVRFINRLQAPNDVGMIGDGKFCPARITVAMVQTLHRHIDDMLKDGYFADNIVLMVDECHHVSSNQMLNVLFQLSGRFRFGLSGTPLKYDVLSDMRLIGATGPVVVDITNNDLISAGYSAEPLVHMHTIEIDGSWELDYQKAYDTLIVHNEKRNRLIAMLALKHSLYDQLVLVMVSRIEHGEILKDMVPGSIFVHGKCSIERRQSVLAAMNQSETTGVVIASPIFDEGVDIPGVDVVILAAGGKSHVRLLQRVGRGLRQKPGRNQLIVHDFIDDTNFHLLNHSEARLEIYEDEKFDIVM